MHQHLLDAYIYFSILTNVMKYFNLFSSPFQHQTNVVSLQQTAMSSYSLSLKQNMNSFEVLGNKLVFGSKRQTKFMPNANLRLHLGVDVSLRVVVPTVEMLSL